MRKLMMRFALLGVCLTSTLSAAEVLSREQFSVDRFADAKVIYLDFWASWCVPCRASFPWLNAMQEKYGDEGLVIVIAALVHVCRFKSGAQMIGHLLKR